MLRKFRRVGLAVAVATAAITAFGTPASATVDPAALATAQAMTNVELTLDVAEVALINAKNPDVTCSNPTAVGAPATIPVSYVAGETYGIDAGEASGTCVSLQGRAYTGSLTVAVQYQPVMNGPWYTIPGCTATSSGPAINGVLELTTPPVACQYRLASAPAGKPHRAHAVLTNSQVPSAVYDAPSAVVWPGGI